MEQTLQRLLASQEQMTSEMRAETETNNEKFEVLQENVWTMWQRMEAKV
jgi:predicted ribosome quality control (RQC) complex YloA/Tae2 family protein